MTDETWAALLAWFTTTTAETEVVVRGWGHGPVISLTWAGASRTHVGVTVADKKHVTLPLAQFRGITYREVTK